MFWRRVPVQVYVTPDASYSLCPKPFDVNVLLQKVALLVLWYSLSSLQAGVEVLQVFCLPEQVVLRLEPVGLERAVGTQQAAGPEGGLYQAEDEDPSADAHLAVVYDAEPALAPKGLGALGALL